MDSQRQKWKYDVFLSFCRDDHTWNSFTSDLFAALERVGMKIFMSDHPEEIDDDDDEAISPQILQQIQESRISIVVFSTNYAASTRCLEELSVVSHTMDSLNQTVIPLWYEMVTPYTIRPSGVYWEAFAQHQQRFKHDLDKVIRWIKSMEKVAKLPASRNINDRNKKEAVNKIVEEALIILFRKYIRVPSENLVGIDSRVKEIEKALDIGSDDDVVRVVGICGMAGIGKTTLASLVYSKIFHLFESCCFLDINLSSEFTKDLVCLQKQLLHATLKQKYLDIQTVRQGTQLISTRLRHCRILLVLDDVDDFEILQILVKNSNWFGGGSRIIITTRDESVLKWHQVDEIYKVQLLNKNEALTLFCRIAFRCDYPARDFEEVTYSVLEYAKGLPLAIQSLASFLLERSVSKCGHKTESVSKWKSALAEPQKFHHLSIGKMLIQVVRRLPELEREIFLDIACFFVGKKVHYANKIISQYRFNPEFKITRLVEKSIVTISHQTIQMYDMLQEIGQEVIWHEFPQEPGKRSRLWLYDDFRHVMETNTATRNIEAIIIDLEDPVRTPLMTEAFSEMVNLRLLILRNVKFSGRLEYLSNQLRHISWHQYPFTCLPSHFKPNFLVELIMPESNITQLWEGVLTLPKLRSIHLSGSKNLLKTPNFEGLPNLEMVDLEGCIKLVEVDPSIASLPKLTFLSLRNCTSLVNIPNALFGITSVATLNLAGCSKLAECLNFHSIWSSVEVKPKLLSIALFALFVMSVGNYSQTMSLFILAVLST